MTGYFAAVAAAVLLAACSRWWNQNSAEDKAADLRRRGLPLPEELPPDRRWNLFDVGAVGVLIAFAAFRYQVGTDWPMYYRYYFDIGPHYWPLSTEIAWSTEEAGYTTLEYLLKLVSDWPYLIFWAASTLAILPAYAAMKKQTSDLRLSVLFFATLSFWVAPFNIVRQGIAMGLNFWAAQFLDRKKPLFFIVNAVAGAIHTTAWIAAAIQWLASKIRLNWWTAAGALGAAAVGAVAFAKIGALSALAAKINPRYELSLLVHQSGTGTYLTIAVRIALLGYCAWRGISEGERRWFTYSVIGAALLILGTQNVTLNRMDLYFGVFLVLLLPAQLRKGEHPILNTLIYSGAAVYLGMYLVSYGNLLPYHSYWHPSF